MRGSPSAHTDHTRNAASAWLTDHVGFEAGFGLIFADLLLEAPRL